MPVHESEGLTKHAIMIGLYARMALHGTLSYSSLLLKTHNPLCLANFTSLGPVTQKRRGERRFDRDLQNPDRET